MNSIPFDDITHGWLKPVDDPQLGVSILGQSAVRVLRFRHSVSIRHLELPLLQGARIAGRWVPLVPTHPAHVTISVLDRVTGQWKLVRDVDLPPIPGIDGDGVPEDPVEADLFFTKLIEKCLPHRIDLDGLETDHLRVECDREHQVYGSHGECNGPPNCVPFGILQGLTVHGQSRDTTPFVARRGEILEVRRFNPCASDGMTVKDLPNMLLFEGRNFAIGFSLRRPLLMHLGWDSSGDGGATCNRLNLRRPRHPVGGSSGPILRGLDGDVAAHLWTGSVEVEGNQVRYSVGPAGHSLTIHATFTVSNNGVRLEIRQECRETIRVIEAEAWRFAWDLRSAMTSNASVPSLYEGRNGEVNYPVLMVGQGCGALLCEKTSGDPSWTRFQTESYRCAETRTDGIVLAERPTPGQCLTLEAGNRVAGFDFSVVPVAPEVAESDRPQPAGVRKHWGSVFACFRPELGGFSNHAASINCHQNQWASAEVAAHTACFVGGSQPIELARFSITRALMNGGGYGFHRARYLDSDAVLVSMAGRIHGKHPDAKWLESVRPGLRVALARMLASVGASGLVVCDELSGNSGSFRWSSNAMDVIGFGHIDAYVNAWSYRAFRNAATLFRDLKDPERSAQASDAADAIRSAFAAELLNPDTGWVAGWRSRDGQLHDAAFIWVNGPAIAFGLLDGNDAHRALANLESLRMQVGMASARCGMPCNLLPIPDGDHMLGTFQSGGNLQPTFESYTDGGVNAFCAAYYLRALDIYGLHAAAEKLADDLDDGFANDIFTGTIGEGQEFASWEGLRTGYEGSLAINFAALYAIAVQKRLVRPSNPEWWVD